EAENGRIHIYFHERPAQTLLLRDFSITQRINQEHAGTITPHILEWVEEENKAILHVPEVTPEIWSQTVTYEVGYMDSALVQTAPFTIEGDPAGLNQVVLNS